MTYYNLKKYAVAAGRTASEQEPDWLLNGLIEKGDQWIVCGAPKCGKSLLASELALAVASGGKFLNWENTKPARVLYMDFELKERLFWKRFFTMVDSCNISEQEIEPRFFRCGDFQTTDVLNSDEAQKMKDIVNEIKPDFIVWDVLARMHNATENDNAEMGRVMRAIRLISGSAAHVVVHHARKAGYETDGYNPGAVGMRGASSIHGEADGVIALAARTGQGGRYSLKFSSRAVETPDEILLDRTEHLKLVIAAKVKKDWLKGALQNSLQGRTSISVKELVDRFGQIFSVKERQAKGYIKKCVEQGWIKNNQKADRSYEYQLLTTFSDPDVTLSQQGLNQASARMQ